MSKVEETGEVIQIDLDVETQEILVSQWVEENLSSPSVETFHSGQSENDTFEQRLYYAILNEKVINIVKKQLENIDEGEDTNNEKG